MLKRRINETEEYEDDLLFYLKLDGSPIDSINGLTPSSNNDFGSYIQESYTTGSAAYLGSNKVSYNISNIELNTKNFTIEFNFIKLSNPGHSDYRCIFSTSKSRVSSFTFRYGGYNYGFVLHIGDLWYGENTSWMSDSFNTNCSNKIKLTRSNNVYRVYFNGILSGSVTSSRMLDMNNLYFSDIGYTGDNGPISSDLPPVYIDEFKIYNGIK